MPVSHFSTGIGRVSVQNVDTRILKHSTILIRLDNRTGNSITSSGSSASCSSFGRDVSLASLSELITQMEGRIKRHFDSIDERLDFLEYSVELLQDDVEDDVDGCDDAPETYFILSITLDYVGLA
ncbi:hypothetical protein V6N13_025215 [Hibiscus sabdariffa]|uniref:Uncharacterized protein n=2 Tax=Hibiscus sabdariffa TaxID=183260 RepID=A0ABR2APK3_9ROSI